MAQNKERANTAKTPKSLSNSLKFFYGVGDFGFTLMSNVETFYFTFFLTNVAAFTVGVTAIISSIVTIVDAVTSWMFGAFLNMVKPRKGGRYRPWLIMIPWIVPFIFAFEFIKISDNVGVSAVIITVAAVIVHFIWNIPWTANVTMIAVVGQTPEGRASLSSSRGTWNNLSSVVFSYAFMISTVLAGIVGEANKYAATAFVLGIVMVVGYYVHYKITKGYEVTEEVTTEKQSKTKTSFKAMAKSLFTNPHLVSLILADLAKWCVKFVVAGSAMYYWTYIANNKALMPQYILWSSLFAVAGAYAARYVAKWFTNKNAMVYAYLMAGVCMIISFLVYDQFMVVLILMSIAQFGYGIAYAAGPALYADTAVYAEWKTGKSNVGWIMGLQVLPLKVGVILRAGIIAACLAAVSWTKDIDPATTSETVKQGITASFALIPGLFLIVGAILLAFGFRLTKEKVLKYQTEIDAKK